MTGDHHQIVHTSFGSDNRQVGFKESHMLQMMTSPM
jgi:hypothetical protein